MHMHEFKRTQASAVTTIVTCAAPLLLISGSQSRVVGENLRGYGILQMHGHAKLGLNITDKVFDPLNFFWTFIPANIITLQCLHIKLLVCAVYQNHLSRKRWTERTKWIPRRQQYVLNKAVCTSSYRAWLIQDVYVVLHAHALDKMIVVAGVLLRGRTKSMVVMN